VDMHLERLLDAPIDEALVEPSPASDLQYAFIRTQQTLAYAELEGAPEERLELLRLYLGDVKALLDRIMAAAPANTPTPAPGAAPAPAAPEVAVAA